MWIWKFPSDSRFLSFCWRNDDYEDMKHVFVSSLNLRFWTNTPTVWTHILQATLTNGGSCRTGDPQRWRPPPGKRSSCQLGSLGGRLCIKMFRLCRKKLNPPNSHKNANKKHSEGELEIWMNKFWHVFVGYHRWYNLPCSFQAFFSKNPFPVSVDFWVVRVAFVKLLRWSDW